MSTLSRTSEAMPRRVSTLSTYFFTRILIAVLLTGLDGFVLGGPAETILRSNPNALLLVGLIVAAVVIVLTLGRVWYKTLRYRKPTHPHTRNPFL